MWPVGLCLHILPGASLCIHGRFLVGPSGRAWERSVFIWTLPSRLDFAAESCGIGMRAKIQGISDHENDNCFDSIWDAASRHQFPVVRMFDILYSFSELWKTVLRDRSERKQTFILNKGLLLSDRSLSGRQFHSSSDFQGIYFLCFEELYQSDFTAAKSSNGLSRLLIFTNWLKKKIMKKTKFMFGILHE